MSAMLRTIAITVQNPLGVARALVEIWDGYLLEFPFLANSYVVMAKDERSISIEVYDTEMMATLDKEHQTLCGLSNLLPVDDREMDRIIAVPTDPGQIQHIAAREGWCVEQPTQKPSKSLVIWVENQIRLELSPRMFRYLDMLSSVPSYHL